MIWQAAWPVILVATIATPLIAMGFRSWDDFDSWRGILWPLTGFVGAAVLVVTIVVASVVGLTVGYERRQCDRYQQATGTETQFTRWTYWTYDCYATLPNGTRVTLDRYLATVDGDN